MRHFLNLAQFSKKIKNFFVFWLKVFEDALVVVSTISSLVFIFKAIVAMTTISIFFFNAILMFIIKLKFFWISMTMIFMFMNIFFIEFMILTNIIMRVLMFLIVIRVDDETTSIVTILLFISTIFWMFIDTSIDVMICVSIKIDDFEVNDVALTCS